MPALTVGSLCSGYGGLDLGLGLVAEIETVWTSEVDPAAARVLEARFPGVPNLGDLTALAWEDVDPPDVLTAGYPCQPFSTAGLRQGSNDARHLWPYIADAVSVLRPRLVVLENVAGHLSMGAAAVVGDLAARGYDAAWCLVRASDVGACHRRARLFIVARPTDAEGAEWGGPKQPDPDPAAGPAAEPRERSSRCCTPPPDARGVGRRPRAGLREGGPGGVGRRRPSHDPGPDAPDAGHPGSQGTGIEHADPQSWERSERPTGDCGGPPPDAERGGRIRRPRTPRRSEDVGATPRGESEADRRDDGTGPRRVPAWGAYAAAIARHAAAVGRPAPHPVDARGRLDPLFVEWMMMLPAGWVTDVLTNRSQALKALGNGVVPPQAAYAVARLLELAGAP